MNLPGPPRTGGNSRCRELSRQTWQLPRALFNCLSLQLTLCGTGIINLQVRRTTTFSQETLQLIKNVRATLLAMGFDVNSCPAGQQGVSSRGESKMGRGAMGRGQRWTRDSHHRSGKTHRERRTKSDNTLDVLLLALWMTARVHFTGPQQTAVSGAQSIRTEPWAQLRVPQRVHILTLCRL